MKVSLVAISLFLFTPYILCQVPSVGKNSIVTLSWDQVTTGTDGTTPVVIKQYDIAVTASIVTDLNTVTGAISPLMACGSTSYLGVDITVLLQSYGKSGPARIWVRAWDGVNKSAWSAPLDVVLIFIPPSVPTNLKVGVK